MADFTTGELFGAYRLGPLLGRGGMGVVYRAEHVHLGRTVALKLLSPSLSGNAEFRDRFLRESRLAASIEHPSIVTVYDAGDHVGTLYMAMRFIEGGDLAGVLARGGPMPPSRVLELLGQVGSALDAAHRLGLVHRDVKPGNIMVDGGRCYLTDFGLTKQTISATGGLTATGVFLGTPDYAAPEQIEARYAVDARADVYALAAVLHECLTGSKPFPRDTPVAVLYAQLQDPPPRPSDMRPGLPAKLDVVVARGMAKRPEQRFGTCAELLAAARDALEEVPDVRSTAILKQPPAPTQPAAPAATAPAATAPLPRTAHPQPGRVQRPRRRGVVALGAAAVIVLGIAVVGVLAVIGGGGNDGSTDADSERPPSQPRVVGDPIEVGERPFGVVFADGEVWVANNSGGTVTRAPVDGGESQTIDVGGEPFWLARSGNAIWVANPGAGGVRRIDMESGRVGPPIDAGESPFFVAVDGDRLYVSNGGGNTVSVLDAATGKQERAPIEVGDQPRGMAVTDGALWVASRVEDSVSRVRDGDVDAVRVGSNPVSVAYGADAVWVASRESNTVTRIDVSGDEPRPESIRVGAEPFGVAFGEGYAWVTNGGDDTVMRLDPGTGQVVGDPIRVRGQPTGITVGGGSVWVTANDANVVRRIDPDP